MSLARQFAAVGQSATAAFEEEDCVNLRTKQPFRAKIEPIADLELNSELGRDPRSSDYFHIRDAAVVILANDIISALGRQFKILPSHAPDNAASLHRKFQAMQLTSKDA